jgi:hypothetical protein
MKPMTVIALTSLLAAYSAAGDEKVAAQDQVTTYAVVH